MLQERTNARSRVVETPSLQTSAAGVGDRGSRSRERKLGRVGESGFRGGDSVFDGGGGDDRLEGRARWIELARCPIRQRTIGVVQQGLPLGGGVGAQQEGRVVGRRRHHRQDFAGGRVERHHRPPLASQGLVGEPLQLGIDGELQIERPQVTAQDHRDEVGDRQVAPRPQLRGVGEFEALLAEQQARISDHVGERRRLPGRPGDRRRWWPGRDRCGRGPPRRPRRSGRAPSRFGRGCIGRCGGRAGRCRPPPPAPRSRSTRASRKPTSTAVARRRVGRFTAAPRGRSGPAGRSSRKLPTREEPP